MNIRMWHRHHDPRLNMQNTQRHTSGNFWKESISHSRDTQTNKGLYFPPGCHLGEALGKITKAFFWPLLMPSSTLIHPSTHIHPPTHLSLLPPHHLSSECRNVIHSWVRGGPQYRKRDLTLRCLGFIFFCCCFFLFFLSGPFACWISFFLSDNSLCAQRLILDDLSCSLP